MESRQTTPYVAQDVQENAQLIAQLRKGTEKSSKSFSCKSTEYNATGSPAGLVVKSWRFQDWDYKRRDLPTYARGLFTGTDEKGRPEIVTRGYNKFFNIDEVNNTKWDHIEEYTTGPYEISIKENGCIIFISGLHDGTLLVCSKHSTGPRPDGLSHAEAGSQWINRQLQACGKTREDLARELRRRNVTAVAELCDDEFEEHILAYSKDVAGLYLHGINVNVPELVTYPGSMVHEFGDAWGFRRTDFLVQDDIQSARSFLEAVGETGHYDGRDVEGFVIRCKARLEGPSSKYQDWFFKYKFEEPYLMYRQWRECTKALISGKPPKFRKHIAITEEYLLYAKMRLSQDRQLSKDYNHNHGIIALREDFLREKNLKGSDIIRQEYAMAKDVAPVDRDIILVPIATIGCGKTTIALALQYLFGWGHVQNDNITGKGRPAKFTQQVLEALDRAPVVFADRNNAERRERKQLIDDLHEQIRPSTLVALHFVHTPERMAAIRRTTQGRIIERGDNHQTIQAASDQKKVMGIMENFFSRFQALNQFMSPDDGFDAIIDLDPTVPSRENLEVVISHLHNSFPKLFAKMPSGHELDAAIEFAISSYKPDLRHDLSVRGKKEKGPPVSATDAGTTQRTTTTDKAQKPQNTKPAKKKPLEYIGVTLPTDRILKTLEDSFTGQPAAAQSFLRQLQHLRRVQPSFHITLMHRAAAKAHPDLWARYAALHAARGGDAGAHPLGSCRVLLERIVWDGRVMAMTARLVDGADEDGWHCVNAVAHVTIGTAAAHIKPKESNDMLQRWLQEGSGPQTGISEVVVEDRMMLDGVVTGVLMR